MPVKLTWEAQDAIPDGLKDHAVEQDGKWIFEAETVAEVGNLKNTLKKERDNRAKFEGELKRFERFKPLTEADEDELDEFLERWERRNEKPAGSKGKPEDDAVKDKLHQREVKKLADELGTTKAELEKAQAELNDFRLWTPLRDVFIKAGGEPGDWELARLELASQGRFGFDDDRKIVVLEDGHPSSVSPEKFFKDVYSDQRPKFYRASNAAGSGANNNTAGGMRGQDLSKLSATERLKAARAAGIKD